MSEHTKEPWHLKDWRIVNDYLHHPIRVICDIATNKASRTEENQANAARIVACVNALAGIPTDKLAAHVAAVARLREAAENVVRKEQQAREELMRLSNYDCPISDDMQELAAALAAMEGK